MNERIKQLALQAGITVVPEPFDDASRSWNNTMEKFVELIVKECAWLSTDKTDRTAMFNYFGIKE